MKRSRTPPAPAHFATLMAVLLTVAVYAASPVLGGSFGLAATRICFVGDVGTQVGLRPGPMLCAGERVLKSGAAGRTPERVALALRCPLVTMHTVALPPPAAA